LRGGLGKVKTKIYGKSLLAAALVVGAAIAVTAGVLGGAFVAWREILDEEPDDDGG